MTNPHRDAVQYLKRADHKLGAVIDRVGVCGLKRKGGTFGLLADSIISQQISTHAARTIKQRLRNAMPSGRITADGILSLSEDEVRTAGISPQKQRYLHDLAQQTADGAVNFRRLARIDDEQVIEELTQVKGIGRWTAQMFLMFGLGRPDIFAPADLGLQNAIISIYGLRKRPDERRLNSIAKNGRRIAAWQAGICGDPWTLLQRSNCCNTLCHLIASRTVDAKDVNRGDKAACNAGRPLLYSERRKIYPGLCE